MMIGEVKTMSFMAKEIPPNGFLMNFLKLLVAALIGVALFCLLLFVVSSKDIELIFRLF